MVEEIIEKGRWGDRRGRSKESGDRRVVWIKEER